MDRQPRPSRTESAIGRRALPGARVLALLALALLVGTGCVRVDSGGGGVLWTFMGGTQDGIFREGVHIVAPWNRMYVYDVRQQDRLETVSLLTSNGLSVGMEVSLRYRPVVAELPKLHAQIGPAYYEKILKPALRSVMRTVVGQYTPEEIYSTKREEVELLVISQMGLAVAGKFVEILQPGRKHKFHSRSRAR